MIKVTKISKHKEDIQEPKIFADNAKFMDVMKFFFDKNPSGPNAAFIVDDHLVCFEKR